MHGWRRWWTPHEKVMLMLMLMSTLVMVMAMTMTKQIPRVPPWRKA